MAQGRWVNVPGKGKRWQQPSGELMMTQPGFGPGQFFQTRAGEILAPVKNIASPGGPLQVFADFLNRNQIGARGANAAGRAPTDAELRAQGYGDLVNDAARLRSPTDAQLRAEGYGDLVNDAARLRAPTDAQLRAEGYGDLINDAARLRKPVITPAGVVQPGAIVKGLTPAGTVDYSQGDEYKAQLAQYRNLIQQQKQAEAEDLGMKIFMQQYAKSPIAQAGGAVGAFNPLLAATFPETKGYTGTFAAEEEPLYGRDLGASAQGELGPTMESLNPMAAQAAQQEATATQADMATTAGLSAGDRTRAFLRAVRQGTI